MRAPWLVVGLAACASTPYMPSNGIYGYSEAVRSDGTIEIGFKGNTWTEEDIAERYVMRRAREVCPAGFEIVGRAAGGETAFVAVVRCRAVKGARP